MTREFYLHLAIPSRDLNESKEFYESLGCEIGRVSKDSVIVNFFGMQVVLHESSDWVRDPNMYPRHFGLVLNTGGDYTPIQVMWKKYADGPNVFSQLFMRNQGKFTEHQSFFLKDPSNNLIELKTYKNHEAIFTPRTD